MFRKVNLTGVVIGQKKAQIELDRAPVHDLEEAIGWGRVTNGVMSIHGRVNKE